MTEKVVVTGMGLSTSFGRDVPTHWKNLSDSFVGPDPNLKRGADWGQAPQTKLKGFEAAYEFASVVGSEALRGADFWNGQTLQGIDPARVGCTISASKPFFNAVIPARAGIHGFPLTTAGMTTGTIVSPDVINDFIRRRFDFKGESRNVIAACATGAYAIALGASWIEQGLCDAVLAGSVEPYPNDLIEAGFRRMGVVSEESVMRPFDRQRSGFVFGEGAGAVVLESESHARARGVKIHARLSGWALGTDTHSAYAFNSDGQTIARVIHKALDRARLKRSDVRHVNAHGTATRLNDWIETQALKHAFGDDAKHLMISATKGSTGHLLGAAGSVEFILTILALQHQFVPATAHLENADPECALDYTPQHGHEAVFDHALSLSFGFGGPIGALIVSQP